MSDNAGRIGNELRLSRVSTPSGRERFDLRRCNGDRGGRAASVGLAVAAFLVLFPADARAAVGDETQFVLNSFSFLVWGALVMWMCAGFTMWTLLTKVETSCDRILIAGGANVEAEWEQGPAV